MSEQYQLPEQRPLWKQVREVLEGLIIDHTLKPGERVREQDLSDRFGISRGPIREAIRSLQNDGWLEVPDRQGAFVKIPDPVEMEQLFEVRGFLEGKAAAMASQRIKERELEELRGLVEQGFAAIEGDDMPELIRLNTRFHSIIAWCSGNHVLCSLAENLEKQVIWYLSVMGLRSKEGWGEHYKIIEALERGNPEECAEVMTQHSRATFLTHKEIMKSTK